MSAERHNLRIFGKCIRKVRRVPRSAKLASVACLVYHGMRKYEYVRIGIFFCNIFKSLIEPFDSFLCVRAATSVLLRLNENEMITVYDTMAASACNIAVNRIIREIFLAHNIIVVLHINTGNIVVTGCKHYIFIWEISFYDIRKGLHLGYLSRIRNVACDSKSVDTVGIVFFSFRNKAEDRRFELFVFIRCVYMHVGDRTERKHYITCIKHRVGGVCLKFSCLCCLFGSGLCVRCGRCGYRCHRRISRYRRIRGGFRISAGGKGQHR